MRQTKSTNPELIHLIRSLRKKARENEARIWRDVADYLSRSRQRRVAVNLSKLNRHTKTGETVVVPGKVLGVGRMNHSLNVAACTFSQRAKEKILKGKGRYMSVKELMERNPTGSEVRIIG